LLNPDKLTIQNIECSIKASMHHSSTQHKPQHDDHPAVMASYQEPSWAHAPPTECHWLLVEAKSVEIAKHKLTRPTTILGRATEIVHISLQHESASRQHARIAFDQAGIPWLRDLKSTHGTKCNKRDLPPQACEKVEINSTERGARGIMLFPGDILQFGASTRIYCLEGPPEYERGAQKLASLQTSGVEQKKIAPPPQQKQQNSSVSWGIDMNDDKNDQSTTPASNKTLSVDLEVPEKYRKAMERLNALKFKLGNFQTEDERIRRKGELTEGQERQLQRNAERESNLKESIAELEQDLYHRLYPDKAAARGKHGHSNYGHQEEEDDVDDFYDRTKQQESQSQIDNEAESEKTLAVSWKKLYEQQEYRKSALKQALLQESLLNEELAKLQAAEDEEAFFVQNDLEIATDAVQKIETEQRNGATKIEKIERLLKIVNPRLVVDRETGYFGEGSPAMEPSVKEAPRDDTMLPPPQAIRPKRVDSALSSASGFDAVGNLSMPPPPTLVVAAKPMAQYSNDNEPERIMPFPKRKRVVGPSVSVPPPSVSNTMVKGPDRPHHRQPQGMLAVLSSLEESQGTGRTTDKKKVKNVDRVVSDPKKDEWRAPEGQDGSGITQLNAKFAGRY
jgi:pSer/pThr/pTyr-binding forkhead associated (FHA) protein